MSTTLGSETAVRHVLECVGLTKRYSGTTVLHGVDINVEAGKVLGLVGENGAGKSTLSSILAGSRQPDGGTMRIDGELYAPSGPADALDSGVVLIHQEIKMIPRLTIAENMFLGRWLTKNGRVDTATMNEQSREALRALGVDLDPRRPVEGLSMATQQEIEIAKAILREPKFVVFDEPSASLGRAETARVLDQLQLLRNRGAGVVYISHRLEEVLTVADRVMCLRDGRKVDERPVADFTRDGIIRSMVGRDVLNTHVPVHPLSERIVLSVQGLKRDGVFEDINFNVKEGEIFGFSGLVGAGRTEVVRAIAGADKSSAGSIYVDGKAVKINNTRNAIDAGVYLVPEDRKGQGLNLDRSGGENIALPWENALAVFGILTQRAVKKLQRKKAEDLEIRGNLNAPVGSLSGGNQQKVLLGKWLVKKPKVLILDEPTRGVDVGAKEAIYGIIRDLAASGVAVVVVSSELEEVLGLSNRVLVMANGLQQAILDRADATPDRVMELSVPSAHHTK